MAEDYEQTRERVAEALYRLACPNSTPDGWELYKGMRGRAERFYAQADAAIAALSGREDPSTVAAEAEIERLREALTLIAEWDGSQSLGYEGPRDAARAALTDRTEDDRG